MKPRRRFFLENFAIQACVESGVPPASASKPPYDYLLYSSVLTCFFSCFLASFQAPWVESRMESRPIIQHTRSDSSNSGLSRIEESEQEEDPVQPIVARSDSGNLHSGLSRMDSSLSASAVLSTVPPTKKGTPATRPPIGPSGATRATQATTFSASPLRMHGMRGAGNASPIVTMRPADSGAVPVGIT